VANGNILARGTAANRIVFKAPNTSTRWGNIKVNWNQRTSDIQYCDFERGTTALAFDIDGETVEAVQTLVVTIKGASFQDCNQAAIYGRSRGYVINRLDTPRYNTTLRIDVVGCKVRNTPRSIWLRTDGFATGGRVGQGRASLSMSGTTHDTVTTAILTEETEHSGASDGKIHNNVFSNCSATALDLKPTFDFSVRNNIFANCKVGVKRTGTTSSQVGFNCFHNTQTQFSGYPSGFGTVAMNNANGTPCDVAFNIFENPRFAETVSFLLAPDSPCIDAGDPAAVFNDVRFPPSRGDAVNDIGAYGGPNVLADDADMDGLLDSWEIQYFGDLETTDGTSDPDQDGLINAKEAFYGTNPSNPDTDGDGFNDLAEVSFGTSPTDPNSVPTFALAIQVAAFDLDLSTANGRRYQLQASEGLGLWDNLFDPIVGDGSIVRKRVEVAGTNYRFFRVKDITSP